MRPMRTQRQQAPDLCVRPGRLRAKAVAGTLVARDLAAKYKAMKKAVKPAKVALTAIMRKLIELANTLIKQDRKWTQLPA